MTLEIVHESIQQSEGSIYMHSLKNFRAPMVKINE